ncbi:hypothetical protein D9M69_719460 [compost metagenome]
MSTASATVSIPSSKTAMVHSGAVARSCAYFSAALASAAIGKPIAHHPAEKLMLGLNTFGASTANRKSAK